MSLTVELNREDRAKPIVYPQIGRVNFIMSYERSEAENWVEARGFTPPCVAPLMNYMLQKLKKKLAELKLRQYI